MQDPPPIIYPANPFQDTTYYISLTTSNLCGSVSSLDSVLVHPSPTTNFGININNSCSPAIISFSNITYGLPTSYLWSFGDNTFSSDSLPPPHYFYSDSVGTPPLQLITNYSISLIAQNACNSDTMTKQITVFPNEVNAFFNSDQTNGCAPLTVNFTNYSIGATSYEWNFGDGGVSSSFSTSHTFDSAGTYFVYMVATDNCGFDTAWVNIEVWPQPNLPFITSSDSSCFNTPVLFSTNSASITSVFWNFGDGSTDSTFNTSHLYSAPGVYQTYLTGSLSPYGCRDTVFKEIVINPTPQALIDSVFFSGCQPLSVSLSSQSLGSINNVLWNFGDGSFSNLNNVNHVYINSGSFITTLTGTASSWTFGDGQSSGVFNPTHTYQQSGNYNIQLITTTSFGCSDTSNNTVHILPKPIAAFDSILFEGCQPLLATFNNNTIGVTSALQWSFGDGNFSSVNNPTHLYVNAGTYQTKLYVENIYGCKDSTIGTVCLILHTRISNQVITIFN